MEERTKEIIEFLDDIDELYSDMRKDIENITAKAMFEKITTLIEIDTDSPLYHMFLVMCDDIDSSFSTGTDPAHHNRQHFIEVMANCFIIGKFHGLDDDTIAKLMFTGLIHDYKHPGILGIGTIGGDLAGQPSRAEILSCREARKLLLSKKGTVYTRKDVDKIFAFATPLIVPTDVFSKPTVELVDLLKSSQSPKTLKTSLKKHIKKMKKSKAPKELIECAKYFYQNPQCIEYLLIVLESDILSSCLLPTVPKMTDTNIAIETGRKDMSVLQQLRGQLAFMNDQGRKCFGQESHPFHAIFESRRQKVANELRALEETPDIPQPELVIATGRE
ncbi:hypothetical protein ACFL0U_00780 [Pseudomonadota bacterium]